MAEQVEVGLQVRVAVGVVGAEALAGQVERGGFIEACGEGIGPGVAPRGVGAPAGGIVPAVATAGGIGVDGDEDDVAGAEDLADGVYAAAALGDAIVALEIAQPGEDPGEEPGENPNDKPGQTPDGNNGSGNGENGNSGSGADGEQNNEAAVQTGDNSPIMVYGVLVVIAAAGIICIIGMRKRRR